MAIRNKITDPIKARAAVAEAISMGFKIDTWPSDGMKNADWIELANSLLKWTLDECAKHKVLFLPIRRK